MFQTAHLTPEQNKAISQLEDAMKDISSNTITNDLFTLQKVTSTGEQFFVNGIFKTSKIPRESKWIWNQSRGRQEFSDANSNIKVCFFKLNTKKSRKYDIVPPQYKLWVFNIYMKQQNKEITWFWCEKGSVLSDLDVHLLSDLCVLDPFTSNSCASELGWDFSFEMPALLELEELHSASAFDWLNDF